MNQMLSFKHHLLQEVNYPTCIQYARCLLGERRRQRWAVRGLLADAKVPLRLFEDEILEHRCQLAIFESTSNSIAILL